MPAIRREVVDDRDELTHVGDQRGHRVPRVIHPDQRDRRRVQIIEDRSVDLRQSDEAAGAPVQGISNVELSPLVAANEPTLAAIVTR